MKLATFQVKTPVGAFVRLGAFMNQGDRIVDLNRAYTFYLRAKKGYSNAAAIAQAVLPPDMVQYLEGGEYAREAAAQALEYAGECGSEDGPSGKVSFDQTEVQLLAPVPRPRSIRDFFSFEQHAVRNLGPKPDVWYEMPFYYN